jgi:hypothetical protein
MLIVLVLLFQGSTMLGFGLSLTVRQIVILMITVTASLQF